MNYIYQVNRGLFIVLSRLSKLIKRSIIVLMVYMKELSDLKVMMELNIINNNELE